MEMCKVVWIAVLQILLVNSARINKKDMEAWKNHLKRNEGFRCGTPQPRSLKLEDFVKEQDLPDLNNMNVSPPMTVLHRCDYQAGCCKSAGKICAPQVTEDILLTFWAYSEVNLTDRKYIEVVASNHTRCSCQKEIDLPK